MRMIDIFSVSWRNLTANKMRTFLTVLGIAVGIATIVFLVSLGFGLQDLSIKKISSISSLTSIDITPSQNAVSINGSTIAEIEKIANVDKVYPFLSLTGKISQPENSVDVVVNAVNAEYFALQGLIPRPGNVFSEEDKDSIVISSGTAKALNRAPETLIGKKVNLDWNFQSSDEKKVGNKSEMKIVGVINDEGSTYLYIPLAMLGDYLDGKTVYNSAKVKATNKDAIADLKSSVESKGFKATSVADTIDQVYVFFSYVQIGLSIFGAIALIVASIGMFNTMTVALLERTRDIGIMKAIGVQNSTIDKMFMVESFLISTLGGFIGIALGIAGSFLINFVVNILAKSVDAEANQYFTYPTLIILIIFVFSLLVGIATGFYPAKRAGRLNPLDALRYE